MWVARDEDCVAFEQWTQFSMSFLGTGLGWCIVSNHATNVRDVAVYIFQDMLISCYVVGPAGWLGDCICQDVPQWATIQKIDEEAYEEMTLRIGGGTNAVSVRLTVYLKNNMT